MNASSSRSPDHAPLPGFVCLRCGTCCRLPGGFVHVELNEIAPMAAALGLSEQEFIDTWCDLAPNRRGLVLKNQPDDACCFLTDEGCRIHAVKPTQCRNFPYDWHNPDSHLTCPGLQTLR